MNQPQPRRFAPYRFGLLLVMACNAGVDDPNAQCSQELREMINSDCRKTISCKVMRGEATANDTVDQCVQGSAQQVQNASARAEFLTNTGRCGQLEAACDYVTCAGTGAHGFGEMQAASISYNCQQTMACNSMRAAPACDSSLALSDCVAFTIGRLDSMSTNEQLAYQAANSRCASLTSCDFVSCIVQ